MLSNAQEVEKTATEIASTAGDYNLSLIDLQQVWFDAVREYLTLCDTLGKMYRYCDQSPWDVTAQLLKPEIAVARHFDQPWEDEEDLKNVREKYMPAMEELEPEA